jgi:hypothetical protein
MGLGLRMVLRIPDLLSMGLRTASSSFALDTKVAELHPLVILAQTIVSGSIVKKKIVDNLADLFQNIIIIIN